jgi:hypothetical protein
MAPEPSFYKQVKQGKSVKPNAFGNFFSQHGVLILGAVALGAGVILILRSRESGATNTQPALTLYPSTEADAASVQNALDTVNALQGLGYSPATATAAATAPSTTAEQVTTSAAGAPNPEG